MGRGARKLDGRTRYATDEEARAADAEARERSRKRFRAKQKLRNARLALQAAAREASRLGLEWFLEDHERKML